MFQAARQLRLPDEAGSTGRVLGPPEPDLLEGHLAVQLGVEGHRYGPQPAPGVGPEDRVVLRTDLDRAMRQLREVDRLILVLHFYLDMPLEEVGRVVRMSPGAVKTRMYRATRSLRPAMRDRESL